MDKIAVLGSGTQAYYQLWGLPDRLRGVPIEVYSPDPEHRVGFAARVRRELGLPASARDTRSEVLADAEVVIVATASARPVFDARELSAGAYVTTVGPKQVGRAEFDRSLAEEASLLVTDSIAQVRGFEPPHLLDPMPQSESLFGLGEILDSGRPAADGLRVFFSVGLAGTEVHLLSRALESQMLAPNRGCPKGESFD